MALGVRMAAGFLLTSACAGDALPDLPDEPIVLDLVAVTEFEPDRSGSDPFGPVPFDASCVEGFGTSRGMFDVQTDLCSWGTFVQPSRIDMLEGDTLQLLMYHDPLVSEEPGAAASLGLALGQDIVWQTEISIPAPQRVLQPEIDIDEELRAGTVVRIHVHNHGANAYHFAALRVRTVR